VPSCPDGLEAADIPPASCGWQASEYRRILQQLGYVLEHEDTAVEEMLRRGTRRVAWLWSRVWSDTTYVLAIEFQADRLTTEFGILEPTLRVHVSGETFVMERGQRHRVPASASCQRDVNAVVAALKELYASKAPAGSR
jgi:hypothetical protein